LGDILRVETKFFPTSPLNLRPTIFVIFLYRLQVELAKNLKISIDSVQYSFEIFCVFYAISMPEYVRVYKSGTTEWMPLILHIARLVQCLQISKWHQKLRKAIWLIPQKVPLSCVIHNIQTVKKCIFWKKNYCSHSIFWVIVMLQCLN